jgi:hypothetical protein
MKRCLIAVLAAGLLANGLAMLLVPQAWFGWVPSVSHTGPFNPHFVRDIGCAYAVAGLSLLWLLRAPDVAWPAALAGAAFLSAHAGVHLWDALAGRSSLHHLIGDLPGVVLVPVLMLWLAWPRATSALSTQPRAAYSNPSGAES